eukprot:CAMPEP_0197679790 /NCGR_PEP_ID=MMETSP1338-20131121/92250_1 /TAXON_ID=43686 ORGANISM="Pelagodinium beii, Strain RCC1491" /NCGR_SAMPLE_ID=MMETSP1338 /ASSEMBLY_ACC=CAM_ASM_000754 /LENGTH=140 /DNA_ID=CAMNT_0043260885 /DNA_START=1 /DNA_END=423 /DNA_ORIENTATION=+
MRTSGDIPPSYGFRCETAGPRVGAALLASPKPPGKGGGICCGSTIDEALEIKAADDSDRGSLLSGSNAASSSSMLPRRTRMASLPPQWPMRSNGQQAICTRSRMPPTAVAVQVSGPAMQAKDSYCSTSASKLTICQEYHS